MIDVPRLLQLLGIEAKQKGRSWWAKCPYPSHTDTEPSWKIEDSEGEDSHGLHYCFGCEQGGTPVVLVQAVVGISYGSAREWLKAKGVEKNAPSLVGVRLEVNQLQDRGLFKLPHEVCMKQLQRWPKPIQRYAAARGITEEQVDWWGIGYALQGRLSGRIVFPFVGDSGMLESYSARSFAGEDPRYLTPGDEEHASADAVFGAQHWPAVGQREEIVVTEGAIDALACERAGAACIAALSGSHLSLGQVNRIASFKRVLIATDPDAAGKRVAAAIAVLSRWLKVGRVRIAAGSDAADMAQEELARAIQSCARG